MTGGWVVFSLPIATVPTGYFKLRACSWFSTHVSDTTPEHHCIGRELSMAYIRGFGARCPLYRADQRGRMLIKAPDRYDLPHQLHAQAA